jgi:PKD repeat protein
MVVLIFGWETRDLGGSYNINLTVTDNDGATDSVSKTIAITSLRGDVNRDGAITSTDAAIVLGVAVRGEYDADADVSGDGSVTSLDALMILQAVAGSITL